MARMFSAPNGGGMLYLRCRRTPIFAASHFFMTVFVYIFLGLYFLQPEAAQAGATTFHMQAAPVANTEFQNLVYVLCWLVSIPPALRGAWIIFRGVRAGDKPEPLAPPGTKRDVLIFCGIGIFLILLLNVGPGPSDGDDAALAFLAQLICLVAGSAAFVRGLVLARRAWGGGWNNFAICMRALPHAAIAAAFFLFPFIATAMQRNDFPAPPVKIDASKLVIDSIDETEPPQPRILPKSHGESSTGTRARGKHPKPAGGAK